MQLRAVLQGVTRSTTTVKHSSISTKVTPPPKKTSIWDIFTMDENRDATTTTTSRVSSTSRKKAITPHEGITSEKSFTTQESSVEVKNTVTTRDVS